MGIKTLLQQFVKFLFTLMLAMTRFSTNTVQFVCSYVLPVLQMVTCFHIPLMGLVECGIECTDIGTMLNQVFVSFPTFAVKCHTVVVHSDTKLRIEDGVFYCQLLCCCCCVIVCWCATVDYWSMGWMWNVVKYSVAGGMCCWSSQTRLYTISGGYFNSYYRS